MHQPALPASAVRRFVAVDRSPSFLKPHTTMASAGPRAGSLRAKLVVNSVLLLSMIAISAPRATRVPAHEWLSLGFVVILALHILYSWNWVISVAQRFFASMRGRMRFSFVWNVALYAMMTVVMLSGLLISVFALPALGIPHNLDPFWETTHERLADWLLVMLGIHLGLHWQWLVTAVSRFLSGTLGAGPKGGRATLWWLGPTGVLTVAAIVFGVATMGLGKTGYAARIRDEHQRQETARKEAQRKRAAAAEAAQTAQAAQAATAGGAGALPARPKPPARPRGLSFRQRYVDPFIEIGGLLGLPFLFTVGLMAVMRQGRRGAGEGASDPLDQGAI